ncbi:MAG: FAD binding domain-containing protein, partial [Candidatus Limnocylindria bacterium]
MLPFELRHATSVGEALELLREEDAHVLAGGTALILLMKQGLLRPARLVSIAGVADLRGIERRPDGSLRIGAVATHRDAERSSVVRDHCGALADAFASVATPRIRAQATVGGSLAHADPAHDPLPMLIALGASAVVASAAGERTVLLDELFIDVFETVIGSGEVLREVVVPPLAPGTRATYVKFLPRTEDDYATVAVAALAQVEADGRCADVRVALGAVG